jgi:16S rRNA A1518/A1519 N6-dimethyltransferase RsmA/KsgA/DIM1 with predicted DNA glycosylase/AP lyase activity
VLVELGPGPGALSRSLLTRKSCGVLGIELDMRFNPYLQRLHQNTGGRFQWINADALEADEMTAVSSQFPSFMELKRAQWIRRLGELQDLHYPNTKPAFHHKGAGEENDENDGDNTFPNQDSDVQKSSYYGGYFGGGGGMNSQQDAAGMFASVGRKDGDLRSQTGRKSDILSRRKHMGLVNNGSTTTTQTQKSSSTTSSTRANTRPLSPSEKSKVVQMAWEATDSSASGAVVSLTTSPLIVFANLPFSVASEMLVRYAMDAHSKTGIYEMGRTPLFVFVQKEVADRLVATPLVSVSEEVNRGVSSDGSSSLHSKYGSRVVASRLKGSNYSRPSVFIQNYFTVKIERIFSEETYYPKTEVLGALVHLRPRPRPLVDVKPASLFAFLNACFKGRMRGPSRPALKSLSKICPPEVARFILESLRIDGNSVPLAQLSVTDLATLALLWETYITKQRMGTPTHNGAEEDGPTTATDRTGDEGTDEAFTSDANYDKFYTGHDPLSSQGAAQRFFDDEDDDDEGADDDLAADHATSIFGGSEGDMDLSNTIDLTGLLEEVEEDDAASIPKKESGRTSAPGAAVSAPFGDNGDEDPSALYGELSTSNVHLHAQEELRRLKALREAQLARRRR